MPVDLTGLVIAFFRLKESFININKVRAQTFACKHYCQVYSLSVWKGKKIVNIKVIRI